MLTGVGFPYAPNLPNSSSVANPSREVTWSDSLYSQWVGGGRNWPELCRWESRLAGGWGVGGERAGELR